MHRQQLSLYHIMLRWKSQSIELWNCHAVPSEILCTRRNPGNEHAFCRPTLLRTR